MKLETVCVLQGTDEMNECWSSELAKATASIPTRGLSHPIIFSLQKYSQAWLDGVVWHIDESEIGKQAQIYSSMIYFHLLLYIIYIYHSSKFTLHLP